MSYSVGDKVMLQRHNMGNCYHTPGIVERVTPTGRVTVFFPKRAASAESAQTKTFNKNGRIIGSTYDSGLLVDFNEEVLEAEKQKRIHLYLARKAQALNFHNLTAETLRKIIDLAEPPEAQ